jgi:hypothetical protein
MRSAVERAARHERAQMLERYGATVGLFMMSHRSLLWLQQGA